MKQKSKISKLKRKVEGITLIALVVTIIVLLILSAVAINLTIGSNGIFIRARESVEEYTKSSIKEELSMLLSEYSIYKVNGGTDSLSDFLLQHGAEEVKDNGDGTLNVKYKGYEFIVNENGDIEEVRPQIQITDLKVTKAEDGTNIPEGGVEKGTKLKITFTANIEGGIISKVNIGDINNGQVTYVTKGDEEEIIFHITGKVKNNIYEKEYIVSLKGYYLKTELSASDIAKNPKSYYGSEVLYSAGTGVSKWRIFYADENNIYLIADDYIYYKDAPIAKNGSEIYETSDYLLSFNDVYEDYEGSSWIIENSLAKKWLNKYLTKNPNTTYENIRAVAYMLGTNIWSKYVDQDLAEYAIGGPTIEMFCESYTDTHPTRGIDCELDENATGYKVTWADDGSYSDKITEIKQDEYNSIYVKSDTDRAHAMWLASPSAVDNSSVTNVYFFGRIDYHNYDHWGLTITIPGIRPVVSLKSNIQLEKNAEGKYEIKKDVE